MSFNNEKKELISNYFKHLLKINITVNPELFYYYNGDKRIYLNDESNYFPSIESIINYLNSTETLSEYILKLEQISEELKNYLTAEKEINFIYNTSSFNQEYEEHKKSLENASQIIDIEDVLPSIYKIYDNDIEIYMKLHRNLNENDKTLVLESIELLKEISKTTSETYKKFNLYGVMPDVEIDSKNRIYGNIELREVNQVIKNSINKEIFIDFDSNGKEEIEELASQYIKLLDFLIDSSSNFEDVHYTVGEYTSDSLDDFSKYINENYYNLDQSIYDYVDLEISKLQGNKLDDNISFIKNHDRTGYFNSQNISLKSDASKGERALYNLIGLNDVKISIRKISAYMQVNKGKKVNMHMSFLGNPGTGKTEVARLLGSIFYENGILPTDKVVEVDRSGLVGEYVGETPQKTMRAIRAAMGGILFIDEAYSLVADGFKGDYGHEALTTLLKAMEDYRGEFCVIFAGYANEMNKLFSFNPGFKSRIQFEINFPNYDRFELNQIMDLISKNNEYNIEDNARELILDIADSKRQGPNFSNARLIRNILDQTIMIQNLRTMGENNIIILDDVKTYINDNNIKLNNKKSKILSPEDELNELVGLEPVKKTIKKIKAYVKRNQNSDNFSMHMVFRGNPGTGKTEVARIISKIFYDIGALKEAKMIEVSGKDLISTIVGETAQKTTEQIDKANNGLLFIDEAYSLISENSYGYGKESIATLIKEMEDRRGSFCCVLAGYRTEMEDLLNTNPGFKSRIQFDIDFPDYSNIELIEICEKMLTKDGYVLDNRSKDILSKILDYYRKTPNFANARTVRNIVQQVIMNQNFRVDEEDEYDNVVTVEDFEEFILEENINIDQTKNRGFGFL